MILTQRDNWINFTEHYYLLYHVSRLEQMIKKKKCFPVGRLH